MKKWACEKTRSIVDSEINKNSAKNSFEMFCSVDLIRTLTEADWLSLLNFSQWDLQDLFLHVVYKH